MSSIPKSPKKVKKRKKKNLAKEKIKQEADRIASSEALYNDFIKRMTQWMLDNYGRAIDLFRRFDINGDGALSLEEFTCGMRDLDAPATLAELTVLAREIDRDNSGNIDYLEFANGLRYRREDNYKDDGLPILRIKRDKGHKCPHCHLHLWSPAEEKDIRYIQLELRMSIFASFGQNHPTAFITIVHAHLPVYGITQIVSQQIGDIQLAIKIYRDQVATGCMRPEMTLADYGFQGNSDPDEPENVLLYYDYDLPIIDCPILLADHYF